MGEPHAAQVPVQETMLSQMLSEVNICWGALCSNISYALHHLHVLCRLQVFMKTGIKDYARLHVHYRQPTCSKACSTPTSSLRTVKASLNKRKTGANKIKAGVKKKAKTAVHTADNMWMKESADLFCEWKKVADHFVNDRSILWCNLHQNYVSRMLTSCELTCWIVRWAKNATKPCYG